MLVILYRPRREDSCKHKQRL